MKVLFYASVGSELGLTLLPKWNRILNEAEIDYVMVNNEYDITKEQKWKFARDQFDDEFLEKNNIDFVLCFDEDLDPVKFDLDKFIKIMIDNNLDMAQPSLHWDSYINHPITAHSPDFEVGRFTDFVEIMCPAFTVRAWKHFREHIDPEENPEGWGLDFLPFDNKGIIDCMTVIHTRPTRTHNKESFDSMAKFMQKYGLTRSKMEIKGELI